MNKVINKKLLKRCMNRYLPITWIGAAIENKNLDKLLEFIGGFDNDKNITPSCRT